MRCLPIFPEPCSPGMADLEKHAIKRDARFLMRLALMLGVALLGATLLYLKMTSPEVASCAATSLGGESGAPPASTQ